MFTCSLIIFFKSVISSYFVKKLSLIIVLPIILDFFNTKKFSNKFDAVFCLEVIEHSFLPRSLIDSLEKMTKKNGYIFLSTPYHGYLKNLVIALLGKFDEHFTSLWDFGHIKFFSKKTLTKLIKEKNLKIVGYGTVGRTFFLWKSMFFIIKKL